MDTRGLDVERYASPRGIVSVFAFSEFTLRVNGQYDGKRMTLRGLVAEDPRRAISMKLVRRAELPQWQGGHMLQSEAIR